ncbi:MAG: FSR family fosmidomycin resistance protein-like MFS transporter [Candidatus Promineifilaceae bacterium]|jgi:FSR family fosmidomycin resistance protein-like MFS transporter
MTSIVTPVRTTIFHTQLGYWATCVTHFFIDFLNNGRSILMALLAVSLGMSNGQVGLILVIYNVGNALSQPFFGWVTDKFGPKHLVVGGMLWMVLFSALTSILPGWWAVVTLTCAGLGSGMFHPAGTTIATRPDFTRRNLATGLFFFFGSAGLFVGPIAAGYFLEAWGRQGYLLSAVIAATAFVFGALAIDDNWFHDGAKDEKQRLSSESEIEKIEEGKNLESQKTSNWALVPVLITIIGYSSVGVIIMTYLPKFLIEAGITLSYAGWVTGSYLFGTMLGTLLGGMLADYTHGRNIIFIGMAGTILPLWFGVPAAGAIQVLLLFIAGLFAALPHSVLVLLIQSLFPKGRGFASGLALGGMFFTGSVFSYFAGILADSIGLQLTLRGVGVLPLLAVCMVFFLPMQKKSDS